MEKPPARSSGGFRSGTGIVLRPSTEEEKRDARLTIVEKSKDMAEALEFLSMLGLRVEPKPEPKPEKKPEPKPSKPLATHCKWGHEFTEENTWTRPGRGRSCITCHRHREKAHRKGKKVDMWTGKFVD